jgi:oryzin
MASFRLLATTLVGILPVLALPVLDSRAANVVPGSYIITLKQGITRRDVDSHLSWVDDVHARSLTRRDTTGVNKLFTISDSFRAYSGSFDESTIQQIEASDQVSSHGTFPETHLETPLARLPLQP